MITAYKGFRKDLTCMGYQFKLNEWNEEKEANCVRNGLHCAANPLDCLSYYPNWQESVYYLVLADGDINEDGNDSKISCTKMKLVKQLSLEEFIAHSLNYMAKHPFIKCSSRYIADDKGTAINGFIISRGKNPVAKGKTGDIIGFAKEELLSPKVIELGMHLIDGEKLLPDTYYRLDGSVAGGLI